MTWNIEFHNDTPTEMREVVKASLAHAGENPYRVLTRLDRFPGLCSHRPIGAWRYRAIVQVDNDRRTLFVRDICQREQVYDRVKGYA